MATTKELTWNLEPLVFDRGPSGVDELLGRAEEIASRLESYRGRIASLDGDGLADLMDALEELRDNSGRAAAYAYLRFTADTSDESRGALLQSVQERLTGIATGLKFIELEWAALDDHRVEELLAHPRLERARHYLRSARRYRPHLLSEPEERIMAEKAVTGAAAWARLFDELTSAISVEVDGRTMGLEQALSRLSSPDRNLRRRVAEAVTAALAPGLKTRAFIFNTLLSDKAIDDRLRRFPHWLASRNLDNEASDESVKALLEAVRTRSDIPRRWYRIKARLLGLDRLADYDRMATLAAEEREYSFEEARELVLESFASFSEEFAAAARRFFEGRWIDVPATPGKRPGAFCHYAVPSANPYILLNYTSRSKDVLTLAHELGHGIHSFLARGQGVFHYETPLTVAETASVFGETVVFNRLLSMTSNPNERLALLAENVEGAIATVFRQTAMNRFEELAHNARRSEGELPTERLNQLWEQSQAEMFGDSMEITPGYRTWWSYIPHFIHSPGYVYAYAYGQLLALSVYRRYEERGPAFVPSYLRLLSAGGSMPPEELARIVDCDLSDPGFWEGGLAIIDAQVSAAEEAARSAGRL